MGKVRRLTVAVEDVEAVEDHGGGEEVWQMGECMRNRDVEERRLLRERCPAKRGAVCCARANGEVTTQQTSRRGRCNNKEPHDG